MLTQVLIDQLTGSRKLMEWTQLELTPSAMLIDGGGADTGGRNKLLHGPSVWTPGATFAFQPKVRPIGQPWDNVYRYNTLTRDHLPCVLFAYEFSFILPSQKDLDACTAVEVELELCEAGLAYDMGWQYLIAKGAGGPAWRWFDETAHKWFPVPGLPAPTPKAGAIVSLIAFFSVNRASKTTTHEGVMIDGTLYPISATHKAEQKWSPATWYFHHAVQLDSDGRGSAFGIQVKSWNARAI